MTTPAAPILSPAAVGAGQAVAVPGLSIPGRLGWAGTTGAGLLVGCAVAVVLGLLFLVREPSGAPALGTHFALALVFSVPGGLTAVLQRLGRGTQSHIKIS